MFKNIFRRNTHKQDKSASILKPTQNQNIWLESQPNLNEIDIFHQKLMKAKRLHRSAKKLEEKDKAWKILNEFLKDAALTNNHNSLNSCRQVYTAMAICLRREKKYASALHMDCLANLFWAEFLQRDIELQKESRQNRNVYDGQHFTSASQNSITIWREELAGELKKLCKKNKAPELAVPLDEIIKKHLKDDGYMSHCADDVKDLISSYNATDNRLEAPPKVD